jgi:hypothetical protein
MTPDSTVKPRILFLYHSYTKQTLKLVETMASMLLGVSRHVTGEIRVPDEAGDGGISSPVSVVRSDRSCRS